MMGKSYHMQLNVEHMATMSEKTFNREWKGAMKHEKTGAPFTYSEVTAFFLAKWREGFDVFPIGECDNFDPKKGCQGHDVGVGE
jgi:hypothetical protein